MFERMSCKGGMIHFDIHFEVLIQSVSLQEADNCLCIDIILMLCRFHGFRFNQESALETTCTSIITGNGQHLCQMFFFAFLISIQQRHIPFASTPKDIIRTSQFNGGINRILYLDSGTGHNIKIGIGGCAVHVTRVAEYIGRSPQQFDACFGLFLLSISNQLFQVGLIGFDAVGFRNQIDIMEAIIPDAHFLHKLETGIHFILGSLHGIRVTVPWELFGSASKLVTAFGTKCMPPCHCKL